MCDIEEDRMRIFCDGGCLDNLKFGAVVDDHGNKLQDVDQNEFAICIVSFEMKHMLDDFVREC